MNSQIPHPDSLDRLDWSAFCYLAGEMSSVEAEQFELRLAEDQNAREALARAVELSQTVAAAESQVQHPVCLPSPKADWTTRLSWMAAGSLASLLVALLWSGGWHLGDSKHQNASTNLGPGDGRLAAAWSETRAQLASAKQDGLYPMVALTESDGDDDTLADSDSMLDDVARNEAPSWMTTAVYGLAGEPLENALEPFMDERGEN